MPKAQRSTLKKLDPRFLQCHLYGHAWEWTRDEELVTNTKKVVIQCTQVDRCLRCTMNRWGVFLIPSWDLVGNYHYDAPEGYYLEKVDGHRISRAEFRGEFGRRRNRKFRIAA